MATKGETFTDEDELTAGHSDVALRDTAALYEYVDPDGSIEAVDEEEEEDELVEISYGNGVSAATQTFYVEEETEEEPAVEEEEEEEQVVYKAAPTRVRRKRVRPPARPPIRRVVTKKIEPRSVWDTPDCARVQKITSYLGTFLFVVLVALLIAWLALNFHNTTTTISDTKTTIGVAKGMSVGFQRQGVITLNLMLPNQSQPV